MTRGFRAQTALAENQNSVPSTYMAAHNHLWPWLQEIQGPLLVSEGPVGPVCCDTHNVTQHTDTEKLTQKKKATLQQPLNLLAR